MEAKQKQNLKMDALNAIKYDAKSLEFIFFVYIFRDLIVRWSEQCGRGAVVVLFKVANDAWKNKQIFTTDEGKTKGRPQRASLSVLQYAVTVWQTCWSWKGV